ncbi:unnamed protein product [Adineta ricciae]|uniref:protein-disulfide reductase n=1 Tax=Adineta ricciae TaxID=249248 RepID=A0A814Q5N8_ADIRI|nr:unnamed protein product [Adineta ricciae]CAF1115813.1 unnamed protein product [Adineta ricciae]
MFSTLKEILGEKLVQHNQSDDKPSEISADELNGKSIALYFSAYWCPPCRNFTPMLAKVYKDVYDEISNKVEVVFLSCDVNEEEFNKYLEEMPWKAVPFADRDRPRFLGDKLTPNGLPSLIVLSPSFEIITKSGLEEVQIGFDKALRKWSEGKSLFWTRPPQEGEHIWKSATCTGCFMNPIVGSRHTCLNKECQISLCKECLSKTKHEHPLIDYFLPTQHYSLAQLLTMVPYLLDSKTNEEISTKTLLDDNLKSIGFYFSAQWCVPSQTFTPLLAKFYEEIRTKSHHFNILFLSCDKDIESFHTYRSQMPWPAAPFNYNDVLPEYFGISNIPSLIIVSSNGQILSRQGFQGVEQHGIKALETWSQGETLTRPSPDKYKWLHCACDVCGINPIVGERYSCPTCGNYDLCSTCQKKGHQHELQLQPLPNEDD